MDERRVDWVFDCSVTLRDVDGSGVILNSVGVLS